VPPHPQHGTPRPVVHVIGGIAWLIFWALALYSPRFFWVWGSRGVFSPSDALYSMRFALWLLAFLLVCQSWLRHTRFAAASWRRVLGTGIVAAGIVLGVFLLTTGDLLVAGPKWTPTQAHSLATMNQMLAGVLAVACILAGLAFLPTFIRIIRRSSDRPRTANSTS
jgi:hypothetical protein